MRGEHLDDLAGDQRGVAVEADQPLGAALQARALNGDVHPLLGGQAGQGRANRIAVIADSNKQLKAVKRGCRQPANAVNVRVVVGQLPSHRGHVAGVEVAAQHHDHVGGARAGGRLLLARGDRHVLGVDAQRVAQPLLHGLQAGGVDANVCGQGEAPGEDGLFNVDKLNVVGAQHAEERRGHSRPVGTRGGHDGEGGAGLRVFILNIHGVHYRTQGPTRAKARLNAKRRLPIIASG